MKLRDTLFQFVLVSFCLFLTGCVDSQERSAEAFWTALAEGNLAAARKLVSADSREDLYTVRDQATRIRLIRSGKFLEQEGRAEFEGLFRLVDAPEGAELGLTVQLVEEEGEWKTLFPSDLLPALVARAFWTAVEQGDQTGALRYSSARSTMPLEQSWGPITGLSITSFGGVMLEGNGASVAISYRAEPVGEQELQSSTSLTLEDGIWGVSVAGTVARIFGNTMGEMAREAAEAMRETMEEAGKVMQENMEEAGKLLQENLEEAGKAMREGLEALKREMQKLEQSAPPEETDKGV